MQYRTNAIIYDALKHVRHNDSNDGERLMTLYFLFSCKFDFDENTTDKNLQ